MLLILFSRKGVEQTATYRANSERTCKRHTTPRGAYLGMPESVLDDVEFAAGIAQLGANGIQVRHLYAGVFHQHNSLTVINPFLILSKHLLFFLS